MKKEKKIRFTLSTLQQDGPNGEKRVIRRRILM